MHFLHWLSTGGGRQSIVLARHVSLMAPVVFGSRRSPIFCFVLQAKFQQSTSPNRDLPAHISNVPKTIQVNLQPQPHLGFQEKFAQEVWKKKKDLIFCPGCWTLLLCLILGAEEKTNVELIVPIGSVVIAMFFWLLIVFVIRGRKRVRTSASSSCTCHNISFLRDSHSDAVWKLGFKLKASEGPKWTCTHAQFVGLRLMRSNRFCFPLCPEQQGRVT